MLLQAILLIICSNMEQVFSYIIILGANLIITPQMPKRGRRVLCETRVFARPPVSMGTARNSKNNLIKSYFTTSSSRER